VQKIGTFDLGGLQAHLRPSNNRGSDQVFLTVIQPDGSFKAVDRLEKSGNINREGRKAPKESLGCKSLPGD